MGYILLSHSVANTIDHLSPVVRSLLGASREIEHHSANYPCGKYFLYEVCTCKVKLFARDMSEIVSVKYPFGVAIYCGEDIEEKARMEYSLADSIARKMLREGFNVALCVFKGDPGKGFAHIEEYYVSSGSVIKNCYTLPDE